MHLRRKSPRRFPGNVRPKGRFYCHQLSKQVWRDAANSPETLVAVRVRSSHGRCAEEKGRGSVTGRLTPQRTGGADEHSRCHTLANGRRGPCNQWRWSARSRRSCQPVCVSVASSRRRVAARLSGAEGDSWGRSQRTNDLGQNREQEGRAILRKIPRKYGVNAQRRERWLSALCVNPCRG